MADEPDRSGAENAVDIRVTRAGGVAGIRRGWCVESPEPSAWEPLVEACPWDEVPDAELTDAERAGADHFEWIIEVLAPAPARSAALPEDAVDGPWRELVDRVRDEGRTVRPAPPRSCADGTPGSADG